MSRISSGGGGRLDSSDIVNAESSRSLGIEYQNTGDYDIFVAVNTGNSTDGAEFVGAGLYMGMSSGLDVSDRLAFSRTDTTDSSLGQYSNHSVFGIIPAGAYYKVTDAGQNDDTRLDEWTEQPLKIE